MFRFTSCVVLALFSVINCSAAGYSYTTVENDPSHSLLYTLPNGLKVYMNVNKDRPRIDAQIAVKVGGKNDPAETTGLAHYFEHLMFKGTKQFGTSDYAAEKPLLDRIEQLFEIYRQTTDSAARADIYHQIDSISYVASTIAIPNEYDKLMSMIGAQGTNAYTSNDQTVYVENIPSNQIDNWARIQADRFMNPVLRGFHTELETIYEEKNMSLTRDSRKMFTALMEKLFPHHPYGTQTVLGTQEDLKNPSITNVINYHKQWYVPNNMAIALSGDFDPDKAIEAIEKYFGQMQPNANLPKLNFKPEPALTHPIDTIVYGPEAPCLYVGWRLPGSASRESVIASIASSVLYNGSAGIIDTDIIQQQSTLGAWATAADMADYSIYILYGSPKEGQTLQQVRELLMECVDRLRKGDFDDDLIPAIINNTKLSIQQGLESTDWMVGRFIDSFINGISWEETIEQLKMLENVTKADVVAWANKYLGNDNYVTIFKEQGEDKTEMKIAKPNLTPIATNRDKSSAFLNEIGQTEIKPIEPSFPDYQREITFLKTKSGIPVLYKRNTTTDLFFIEFMYELGEKNDRTIGLAANFLQYVGTKDMTPEQIQMEFYKLACSFNVQTTSRRTFISLSGLSENMPKALELLERLIREAVGDKDKYSAYIDRTLKARNDAKANQSSNFSALINYVRFGRDYVAHQLSADELRALTPQQLIADLQNLTGYEHTIFYYGPRSEKEMLKIVNKYHITPKKLKKAPAYTPWESARTTKPTVFVAPYKAKQLYMRLYSNRGEQFDAGQIPEMTMYNEYFGGGMNSIVFQEMRESRSLAYSAWAQQANPGRIGQPITYHAFIATQNDKLKDAVEAFDLIINDMPQSEAAFNIAKTNLDNSLRTRRVIKSSIFNSYLNALDMGLDHDINRDIYNALPNMSMTDVIDYQKKHVKDNTYFYCILGDIDDLDMELLKNLGEVVILSTEDIFGY